MSVSQSITKLSKAKSGRRPLAVALAVALVTTCAVAVSARAWLGSSPQATEVRTTLGQDGFAPAEVTRDAGRVRVTVVNSSGREGLTFRLITVDGGQLYQGQMAHGASEWSEEFDLPAGQYVLTEVNNPAWLFYVTTQ